jgi:uncharacterized protein DUF2752
MRLTNSSHMNGLEQNRANPPVGDAPKNLLLSADQRKFRVCLAALITGVLVGAALLPLPPAGLYSLPTCAFKGITGLPCGLCGGTRAAWAFLHGDLSRALYLNIAALPAVIAVFGVALVLACEAVCGRALTDWNALLLRFRSLLPIGMVLFCLFWFVHLVGALRETKRELVDLRNPIALAAHKRFSFPSQ